MSPTLRRGESRGGFRRRSGPGLVAPLLIERIERKFIVAGGAITAGLGFALLANASPSTAVFGVPVVGFGNFVAVSSAYTYTAEIFPTGARTSAMALGDGVGHLAGATTTSPGTGAAGAGAHDNEWRHFVITETHLGSSEPTREFASVSDAAVANLRAMIGEPIRSDRPHIGVLTPDAIRHFAYGIGDRNPLWVDEGYAAAHGRPQGAPPSALLAMDKVFSGYVTGLPGIHAMWAGADFRFERPIVAGDQLTGHATLKELRERPSRFAGRSFQQIYEVPFLDESGTLVATGESYCFRTERDTARERGKYEEIRVTWAPEQIADIAERYRDEEARRRGAETRYAEDVAVGDALPRITKGPYTATTAIAFLLGWGGLYVRAHGDAFGLFDSHPALGIPNEWGVPEPPERVHWDPDLARRVGVPGAYDYGPERAAWMGHVVTDWMGDDGFLSRLNVEVRRHNVIGELVTCEGRVTSVDTATGLITAELSAHNQDGHESARGFAEVILPVRGSAR